MLRLASLLLVAGACAERMALEDYASVWQDAWCRRLVRCGALPDVETSESCSALQVCTSESCI